ncbi:unnamed protein product, partial [Adineta ricciae]
PDGERPPRPERNHTHPEGGRPGDKDDGDRRPGGKPEREEKNDKHWPSRSNDRENSDSN